MHMTREFATNTTEGSYHKRRNQNKTHFHSFVLLYNSLLKIKKEILDVSCFSVTTRR